MCETKSCAPSIFLLTLAAIIVLASPAWAQRPVTVILVRHAEKDYADPNKSDQRLSAVGHFRADALVSAVEQFGIRRIFSTDFARTRDTVGPLSQLKGIPITIYDPRDLRGLAEKIKALRKDRRVIVSGHSNTIPPLVNLLIGEELYRELGEFEYNKMFVVKLGTGKPSVKVLTY